MAYSESEIKGFEQKDRRIVRQNALSHATKLVVAMKDSYDPDDGDGIDPQELVEVIKNFAEQFVDWVYEKDTTIASSESLPKELPVATELPTPTKTQQEILEMFQKKYNKTKEDIYKAWGGYPNNVTEAKKCLEKLQETKNG